MNKDLDENRPLYKIVDKDGIEMPDHYSGGRRTYEEAKKMVEV